MRARKLKKTASDLPTKRVRAPDGTVVQMKVVRADSGSFATDFLTAFNANVKRVRSGKGKARRDQDAAEA